MKILECENLGYNPYNFKDGAGYQVYKVTYKEKTDKKAIRIIEIMKSDSQNEYLVMKGGEPEQSDYKKIIDHIEKIKITASEFVKNAGMKNLSEMADITKQSTQTLNNWFNNKRELFEVVLLGCCEVIKQRKRF